MTFLSLSYSVFILISTSNFMIYWSSMSTYSLPLTKIFLCDCISSSMKAFSFWFRRSNFTFYSLVSTIFHEHLLSLLMLCWRARSKLQFWIHRLLIDVLCLVLIYKSLHQRWFDFIRLLFLSHHLAHFSIGYRWF